MTDRALCGITNPDGGDCTHPVPPDAPISACLAHMRMAYLYIRDIIEDWEPEEVNYDPRRHPEPAVVYYVLFGSRIKIGTTTNVWTRITQIPCDRLLAVEPGDITLERERHRQFRALRIDRKGEWFELGPELRKHIGTLRERYGDPAEKGSGPVVPLHPSIGASLDKRPGSPANV